MNFTLDKDKNVIPCDLNTWAEMFEDNEVRRVKLDTINEGLHNEIVISTVFLGLDHGFGERDKPFVFETMIFGGENDQYQKRYVSYEDALKGHADAVKLVKANEQFTDL
jgi:hypothetical protein